MFKSGWRVLILQLAGLVLITVALFLLDGDRRVAGIFYRPAEGWYLAKRPLWDWLYAYGTIPGIVLTLAAMIVWLAGYYVRRLKTWRRPCLVVVLTTMLGAGLLVNAVFKQYWGRPRPDQTIEFGGQWAYRPVFPPGTPGKGASFPCGHCTMGFVFLAMAAFRRKSKALAYGGVAAGIVLGGLLSVARVVQGAHFLSDTIWSLGIVGMTATALAYYLPGQAVASADGDNRSVSPGRRKWITIGALVAMVLVAGGFLTRRPYYNTMVYRLDLPAAVEAVQIQINGTPESVAVQYHDQDAGRLRVDAHGFGWLEFDYRMGFGTRQENATLHVTLHIEARSYFAELDHALTLTLPERLKGRVAVFLNHRPVDSFRSRSALPDRRANNSDNHANDRG